MANSQTGIRFLSVTGRPAPQVSYGQLYTNDTIGGDSIGGTGIGEDSGSDDNDPPTPCCQSLQSQVDALRNALANATATCAAGGGIDLHFPGI